MSDSVEAMKIWKALQPMIDKEIAEKTKPCIRAKKMIVTAAPNTETGRIGVAEPYGDTFYIPFSSALTEVEAGDTVWVWYYYNNASTMFAVTHGDGQMNDFYQRLEATDESITEINEALARLPSEVIAVRSYDSEQQNVEYDYPGYFNFSHDITGYTLVSKTVCLIREIVSSGVRNSMEASITEATKDSTTTTQALVTNNSSNTKPVRVRLILFLRPTITPST